MSSSLIPISALERIAFFAQLIDAFPKGHPLKRFRGDVYYEVSNFFVLFPAMQRYGWTSGFINQEADAYLARLDSPTAAAEVAWIDKLRAAVHEFDNYRVRLLAGNRLDDGDADGAEKERMGYLLGLLEHPLVEKMVLLLNYLAAEVDIPNSGDEMLFELLHGEWFELPGKEIITWALEVAERQYTQYSTSLRGLLYERVHTPPLHLFTPPVPAGVVRASAAIETLVAEAATIPLSLLPDRLLEVTGIAQYISHGADHTQQQALADFSAFIKEEAARNPTLGLAMLVKLLLLMRRLAFTWPLAIGSSGSVIEQLAALYKPVEASPATMPENDTPAPAVTQPRVHKLDTLVENGLLQKFVMHATALNSFLRCPLEFYYNILIRVPSPRNEATEFGSAVHFALELLFRKMQSNDGVFPGVDRFIEEFEGYMHRHRGSFTPEQFQRRLAYGREVLYNYYEEYHSSWNTIVAVERNFRHVVLNGVPLKGKVDKLEFDGRTANIVDYKTGDPEKSAMRLAPGVDGAPGGDYWRQAVFYKILVDLAPQKQWTVGSAEFDFIEPDKYGTYHKVKLFITAEEVETVTQQIVTAWQRIRNRDYYTGCGQPYCHWCHFVKTYPVAAAPGE